jgi:hypothetical protein
MKKSVIFFAFLVMINHGFAQETKELTQSDKEAIARDLEKAADSGSHDSKTKKILKKVAKSFKESSENVILEVKKLDDCTSNCDGKKKSDIVIRNIGRKIGKGSAWLTTATSKPFLNAAGFLTGVFEKKDKNKDIVALYEFFLHHSKEFDHLYLEAGTPNEMVELMLSKIEDIVEEKSHLILKDYLVSLGIKRDIPKDLSDFELTSDELASIDICNINPDFINNHPEYQELKPILGEVTQDELSDIISSGYFDKSISFENYKAALPKIHEGVLAIAGQVAVPNAVLGVISSSLAGLYTTPVIMADIGTVVSSAICTQKDTQDRFENDTDLRSFCSYVVNRSAYELLKSRAKGYVKGKGLREKIEKKIKERKERRAKRREERELKKLQEEMIKQLPVH